MQNKTQMNIGQKFTCNDKEYVVTKNGPKEIMKPSLVLHFKNKDNEESIDVFDTLVNKFGLEKAKKLLNDLSSIEFNNDSIKASYKFSNDDINEYQLEVQKKVDDLLSASLINQKQLDSMQRRVKEILLNTCPEVLNRFHVFELL
jgi:hypothetical protein